ncbi:MAG: RDD family protein, partial [Phenylobacterium sp.]
AVFTRNALRELEFFLPLSFLLAQGSGVDGWLIALGLVWTGVFLLFPLFNRERLRVGDLVAGTMVVRAPKTVLRSDLAQDGPSLLAELQFTPAEVGVYGVKELHVLETVLRRNDRATVAAVASRIRRRIGRDGQGEVSDRAFLMAYYGALRGRLETRLLFGRRRRDKFDAA